MTWDQFKVEATVIFPSGSSGTMWLYEARAYTQQERQSATNYIAEKIRLLSACHPGMDEWSKIDHIMYGLRPQLQMEIQRATMNTKLTLASFISTAESLDQMTKVWKEEFPKSRNPRNHQPEGMN